jgi:hypothetical protein
MDTYLSQVKPEEAADLLSRLHGIRATDLLEHELDGVFEIYGLDDGRVLRISRAPTQALRPDGTPVVLRPVHWIREAWLYSSVSALMDQSPEVPEESYSPPRHVLHGLLPMGEAFPSQTPMLCARLAELLTLPPEAVDTRWDGVLRVSERVRKISDRVQSIGGWACLNPTIFPALVSFLGEIIRNRDGGHWSMKRDTDGTTWEARLLAANGTYLDFACDLAAFLSAYPDDSELLGWLQYQFYHCGYRWDQI